MVWNRRRTSAVLQLTPENLSTKAGIWLSHSKDMLQDTLHFLLHDINAAWLHTEHQGKSFKNCNYALFIIRRQVWSVPTPERLFYQMSGEESCCIRRRSMISRRCKLKKLTAVTFTNFSRVQEVKEIRTVQQRGQSTSHCMSHQPVHFKTREKTSVLVSGRRCAERNGWDGLIKNRKELQEQIGATCKWVYLIFLHLHSRM